MRGHFKISVLNKNLLFNFEKFIEGVSLPTIGRFLKIKRTETFKFARNIQNYQLLKTGKINLENFIERKLINKPIFRRTDTFKLA